MGFVGLSWDVETVTVPGPLRDVRERKCACTTCDGSPVTPDRAFLCYCGALAPLPAPTQPEGVP